MTHFIIIKKFYVEIGIAILFLATRLSNLKVLPVFTDEAIYTYWAQVALNDPAQRYISLVDGKQPLFIWFAAISQIFINDPLIATRSVSIFSGAVSLFFTYLISRHLFNTKTARMAAFLYVVLPFTLIYDRLALYDSLLTAICLIAVYLSIKLAQKPRLDIALLAGATLGLGLITKSSAMLFLVILPAPLIILILKKKTWIKQSLQWFPFAALSIVLAEIIYNSLRLSQLFYLIERKNFDFIRPIPAVIQDPFALFISNSTSIIKWLTSYLGIPLLLIFAATIIYSLYSKNKKSLLVATYVFFPFTVEIFFNTVLYPRFVLFYVPYIIIIIVFGLHQLKKSGKLNRPLYFLVILIALLYPIYNSLMILTNPPEAKIASSDYGQYIDGWPSGYGVKEVVSVLKSDASEGPVFIGTEGTFGLLPFALNVHFKNKINPQIEGYWPVDENKLPQQVLDAAKTKKTYFLFNENQKEITSPNLELVAKYQKGKSNNYMRLFRVK